MGVMEDAEAGRRGERVIEGSRSMSSEVYKLVFLRRCL